MINIDDLSENELQELEEAIEKRRKDEVDKIYGTAVVKEDLYRSCSNNYTLVNLEELTEEIRKLSKKKPIYKAGVKALRTQYGWVLDGSWDDIDVKHLKDIKNER